MPSKAHQWAKPWALGAVQMAVHEARLEASTKTLTKAYGISQGVRSNNSTAA